jgi:hypothetical protein
MNRRKFLGKLVRLPLVAALFPSWRSEPHQEPIILENATIAAGGDTENGSELVFGDYSILKNCVIYADRVIMGKGSTILDSRIDEVIW